MFKKQETGRSMVEMLGVLAVIGVLSVAGIAGYSVAMRNHRANEIVNAVTKLYVWGQSQNQGAGNKEVAYSTTFGSVPSGIEEIFYKDTSQIMVNILDSDICNQVKMRLGDKASGDCVNDEPYQLYITLGELKPSQVELDEDRCVSEGKYWNYDADDSCFDTAEEADAFCIENERDHYCGGGIDHASGCDCGAFIPKEPPVVDPVEKACLDEGKYFVRYYNLWDHEPTCHNLITEAENYCNTVSEGAGMFECDNRVCRCEI